MITFKTGQTFIATGSYFESDQVTPKSLAGVTIISKIRTRKDVVVAELVFTVTDEALGIYTLTLPVGEVTDAWPCENLYWDLKEVVAGIACFTETTIIDVQRGISRSVDINPADFPGVALSKFVPSIIIPASGASQTLTFATSGDVCYDITISQACNFTVTGGVSGQYQSIILILRGALPYSFITSIDWVSGIPPVPNAVLGRIERLVISTSNGGATLLGSY